MFNFAQRANPPLILKQRTCSAYTPGVSTRGVLVSSYLAQGRYTLFVRIAGNHSVATVFASPKTPVIVKGGVTTLSAVSPGDMLQLELHVRPDAGRVLRTEEGDGWVRRAKHQPSVVLQCMESDCAHSVATRVVLYFGETQMLHQRRNVHAKAAT